MAQLEIDFNQKPANQPVNPAAKKREVVFDVETRFSAADVGGWDNKQLMRIAVAVAHDSASGEYKVFYEEQAQELLALLTSADLVVGFNSRNFDYAVLGGYTKEPLYKTLPTLDLMEEIEKRIGFRVKLDNVAQNTLGVGKSGDGMQSLQWFKEGKLDLVRDYCIQDVKVTLDDGSSHPVDSSDLAFRLAGQIGMRKALEEAGAILLEPVVAVEITTPDDIMGDIMSDLNARRGQIQGMDAAGKGLQRVRAVVPMAEMVSYAADLRSVSQGRATYTMKFAHYQPVPAHLQERIVAEAAQAEKAASS